MQAVGFLMPPDRGCIRRIGRAAAAFLLLAALTPTGCDSPTEVKKGVLVRTLYEGAGRPGRYLVFWNGQDENKKTVPAGDYVCYLEAEELLPIELTALNGTGGRRADTLGTSGIMYIPTEPFLNSLDPNIPEPFYNRDGTNIPFEIAGTGFVRISIHKKP
jgi:hypothetical protein